MKRSEPWGEGRLGLVLDGLAEFVIVLDREIRVVHANAYALGIVGRGLSEVVGAELWELFPHLRETPSWEEIPRVVATGEAASFRYLSGLTGRWLQARAYPVDGAVVFHTTDLSEVRSADERLRGSEGQLRLALAAATLGTWEVDLATGESRYSGAAAKVFGREESEFTLGRDEWIELFNPDDVAHVSAAMTGLLERDEPYRVEFRAHQRDGVWRWIEASGMAVRDADGRPVKVVGVFSDVTERKETEAELERRVADRTAQLEAARRSQESWNYSVSHDLRAPLRAVMSTARILQLDFAGELSPGAQDLLDRQAAAAKRLGNLIDELLHTSRLANQDLQFESLDLSEIARDAAEEHAELCDGAFEITIQQEMRGWGDPRLVRLVYSNFLENAMKYSSTGTKIEVGEAAGAFFVRDQGIGFDMKYEAKVWRPFERLVLDSDYAGTGIGLYNVAQMVARMGGRTWAESVVGRGSTFWFTLGTGLAVGG